MAFPHADYRLMRFCSDDHAPSRRLATWLEVIGRMLLKVDIEPLNKAPFHVDAYLRALPDVHFGAALWSQAITRRSPEIIAKDSKGFYILINTENPLQVQLNTKEVQLEEGDAIFLNCAQEVSIIRTIPGRVTCARVNDMRFKTVVPDAEGRGGQVIRAGNEALRMLTTYLRDIDDKQGMTNSELRGFAVAHIFDLFALALTSGTDAAKRDLAASPNAVKLRAIKLFIAENLDDQDLSIGQIADANRMSARQIQRLFESADTTFSEFLLGMRLEKVHGVLLDPRQAHRSISDIALAAGFSDVSYFNRAFRNHYGASPTAIRQSAGARTDA